MSGLCQNNGNDALDLRLLDPTQTVLVTDSPGHGLYAEYESVPEPGTPALFAAGPAGLGLGYGGAGGMAGRPPSALRSEGEAERRERAPASPVHVA